MAAQAPTFEGILQDLKNGNASPVYLLHGEEGYYIDALVKAFENFLPQQDRDFNQTILFAPQTEPGTVMDICRHVPMMCDRQVVILKECQAVRSGYMGKLAPYVLDPTASTVFVMCSRGAKTTDKELMSALRKTGDVIFESKKVPEYNIPAVIERYIRSKGLSAEPKSLQMICDFIGADLGKIYSEIDKLILVLPRGAAITPEIVEKYIGISREYNSYELVDALAGKDAEKAFRIAAYFRANPKKAPLVLVNASIFGYFADLLTAHYSEDKTEAGIRQTLGITNNFAARRILKGMKLYSPVKVLEIIGAIRAFDVQSKGIGSRQNEHQLFYDLLYHILTAPGRL